MPIALFRVGEEDLIQRASNTYINNIVSSEMSQNRERVKTKTATSIYVLVNCGSLSLVFTNTREVSLCLSSIGNAIISEEDIPYW